MSASVSMVEYELEVEEGLRICLTHLHLQLEGQALPLKGKVLPTEGEAEREEEGGTMPPLLWEGQRKVSFCFVQYLFLIHILFL